MKDERYLNELPLINVLLQRTLLAILGVSPPHNNDAQCCCVKHSVLL